MNFKITWKSIGGLCLALTFSAALSVLLNNKAVGLGVLVMAIMYIANQEKTSVAGNKEKTNVGENEENTNIGGGVGIRKIFAVLGTLVFITVILVAMGVGKVDEQTAPYSLMQPAIESPIDAVVKAINVKVPRMIDADTRFDSATSTQNGRTISYAYTLINSRADQISAASLVAIKQSVINDACSRAATTLLSKGFALEYMYRSNDGVTILDFVIGPNKCIFDPYTKQYGVAS